MIIKFVKNWYSVLFLYSRLVNKITIKFKDGEEITIYKKNRSHEADLQSGFAFPQGSVTWLKNSVNFEKFYEGLYKRYLTEKGFNYEAEDIVTISPMGLKIKIFKPYSFVLDEVFMMRVYGEPSLNERTVIDVGASIADSSLYFSRLGAKIVYAYELDNDRYGLAVKNIELNGLEEKIKIFNDAATSKVVSNLIFEKHLSNVFLKLDCEGCEYQIFSDIEKSALDKIDDIVMEFHKNPQVLVKLLRENGFSVKKKGTMMYGKRSTN